MVSLLVRSPDEVLRVKTCWLFFFFFLKASFNISFLISQVFVGLLFLAGGLWHIGLFIQV